MNEQEKSVSYWDFDWVLGPMRAVQTRDSQGRAALARLEFHDQRHAHPLEPDWSCMREPDALFAQMLKELNAYAAGNLKEFTVALAPFGTEFQQAVWKQIAGISFGASRTYGDIAQSIGRPKASRAVGAATGRNPIGIIVPCHRVLGSTGALTGYAGGLHRKVAMLALERGQNKTLAAVPQGSLL
jgi:methylated-DNA-[protein]-cysteine S-methyltransferase